MNLRKLISSKTNFVRNDKKIAWIKLKNILNYKQKMSYLLQNNQLRDSFAWKRQINYTITNDHAGRKQNNKK